MDGEASAPHGMAPQHANFQSPSTYHNCSIKHYYPPPFRRMLESTYYHESIRLRKTYEDTKKHKKQLEDTIICLKEHVIPHFEMELAHVTTVVAEHALVLAPMRTIPTEVLLCIMSLYLGPDNQTDLLNLSTSAWRLAQVCQRWRSIVLGTASFWSNITIDLRDQERFSEPKHQGLPRILSTYIEHSNTLPLTISFKSNSGVTHLTERTMDILLQCRGRWCNVVLDICPKLMPFGLFSWHGGSGPPRLESLAINISFLTLPEMRIDLFRTAPLLRRVTLFGASVLKHREGHIQPLITPPPLSIGGFTSSVDAGSLTLTTRGPEIRPTPSHGIVIPMPRDISRRLPLSWKQLSTLDLELGAWGDFLPVLKQTPNVVDCCLHSHVFTQNLSHTKISLPNLQSLKLFGTAVFCLQDISTRSLKSLFIGDATKSPWCGQHVIAQFITASSCTLQHLSFQSIPISYHALNVIKAAPSLQSLDLELMASPGCTLFDTLLTALTYTGPGHEFQLPKLRKLSLNVYYLHPHSFPEINLVEMVRSRRRVPIDTQLEDFRLKANIGWVASFDKLKEDEGLQTEFDLC